MVLGKRYLLDLEGATMAIQFISPHRLGFVGVFFCWGGGGGGGSRAKARGQRPLLLWGAY